METLEIEVYRTSEFDQWLRGLRDRKAVVKITVRLDRLRAGNPGDTKPVGDGVHELRLTYGPGYRVYYLYHGRFVVFLLCGGDKSTQKRDIERAKALAKEVMEQIDDH